MGHNKGFRGNKSQKLEGGHRVPFFIRWPDGKVSGGKDISELTAHVDMLPTLAQLCGIDIPKNMKLDGLDFSPLLQNQTSKLTERTVFVHHRQDWRPPLPVKQTCLMKDNWRLINGKELYDIEKDPKQLNDISAQHQDIVEILLQENAQFIEQSKSNDEYDELPVHVIGNANQNEIKLTIQHAIGEDRGIWKPEQVAEGMKNTNNTHTLHVEQDGMYEIRCCRWPKECPGPILGIPSENPKGGIYNYKSISPQKVRIQIANQMHEYKITEKDLCATFHVQLEKGKTFLVTDFIDRKEKYGVYYTYVKYLGK